MNRLSLLMVITALSLSACALEGAQVIGPAGGYVFYDKGNYHNGWRYLELCPEDAGEAEWGPWDMEEDDSGTGEGLGAGYENTRRLLSTLGAAGKAAQLCDEFTFGGFDDWFLPSVDELKKAFEAYPSTEGNYYWSSSYCHISWITGQAYGISCDSSGYVTTYTSYVSTVSLVRPVRRF